MKGNSATIATGGQETDNQENNTDSATPVNIKPGSKSQRQSKNADNNDETVDAFDGITLNDGRKDDWSIDEKERNNEQYDLKVPSFIRLFVIRRIICNYIHNTSSSNEYGNRQLIDDLVNVFNDNLETRKIASEILTRLVNDGIKIYMKQWYNEKIQANIIEMIFNQIILNKFSKQYNKITTYVSNDNDKLGECNYKEQLLNSNDLMCMIFEYLEYGSKFNKDLCQCSLVSSHWLYHSWNVNSVYFANLTQLIDKTLDYKDGALRMWQRLIYAKSIFILRFAKTSTSGLVLDRLSLLKRIEHVNIYFLNNDIFKTAILKTIVSRAQDRIKTCKIRADSKNLKENQLSPLQLPNAQRIDIDDVFFYRIWTNKCEKLGLRYVKNISIDWCQFVIKYCDCTGIKHLELFSASFNFDDHDKDNSKSVLFLLKQLASKFINLKKLQVSLRFKFAPNIILFWQFLKRIILKNNGKVELQIYELKNSDCDSLNKMIQEKKLKISKLIIDHHQLQAENESNMIKFIQQCDKDGLKELEIKTDRNTFSILNKGLFNQLSFNSITTVKLVTDYDKKDDSLNHVNDFLTKNWRKILEKKLFFIVRAVLHVHVQCDTDHDEHEEEQAFLTSFEQLCQNISKLLFVAENGTDILISFRQMSKELFVSCTSIYSSYLKSKPFGAEYKPPNLNYSDSEEDTGIPTWAPRDKPLMYFENQGEMTFALKATNVK